LSFLSLLVLAFGLAMDATAVAATRGLAAPVLRARDVVRVALLFGGFQAAMPVLGYALGSVIGPRVAAWDHWIAFVLLAGLGGKMLVEALGEPEASPASGELFAWPVLFGLAVATSIDALAVGVTLPMLGASLVPAVATIGVVTAVLSGAGLFAGRQLGARLGARLDAVGGAILILLGVKILVEHLAA
jgi:putative Mn2+ efflux pump MntP